MTAKLMQPDDALSGAAEAPFSLSPDAAHIFTQRAERFVDLAKDHAQGDWLRFLGELSAAQQHALLTVSDVELPSLEARERAREHLMPPLAVASLERTPAWHDALRSIVATIADGPTAHSQKTSEVAALGLIATLTRLRGATGDELEACAGRLLDHRLADATERAAGVFVAAALQVYWTALAARVAADSLVRLDNKGLCPCCGSPPVASVVHNASEGLPIDNLRYLHCSLCNTQWNLVRVTCASCDDNAAIAYHSLHGAHPAVRAETCDSCKGYLKIIYREQDPVADPVADDLATLALDLLLDEAGYERAGPNLLLLGGSD